MQWNHDGILLLLADMPDVTTAKLDPLIECFEASEGHSVIRASHAGVPGNPVILPRVLYAKALTLQGDRGAKRLIETCGLAIVEVEIGEAAVLDVDTLDDLVRLGGVPEDVAPKE